MGIVMRTVGLDVGTGRSGMACPASGRASRRCTGADGGAAGDAAGHVPTSRLGERTAPVAREPEQEPTSERRRQRIRADSDTTRGRAEARRRGGVASWGPRPGRVPRLGDDAARAARRGTMTCERRRGSGAGALRRRGARRGGRVDRVGGRRHRETPPFAGALRGRIGPHDATRPRAPTSGAGRWPWWRATRGAGTSRLGVRLVVCKAARRARRARCRYGATWRSGTR